MAESLIPENIAQELEDKAMNNKGECMGEGETLSQDQADQEDQPKKLPYIPKEIWDMIIDAATPSMMKGKIIKTRHDIFKLDVHNGEEFKAFVTLLPVSKDTRKEALSVLSKKTVLAVGISDEHDLNAGAIANLKPVPEEILNSINHASLWEFSLVAAADGGTILNLFTGTFAGLTPGGIKYILQSLVKEPENKYLRRTAVDLSKKHGHWQFTQNSTHTTTSSTLHPSTDLAAWLLARDQELSDQRSLLEDLLLQINLAGAKIVEMLGVLQGWGLSEARFYNSETVQTGVRLIVCCRKNVSAVEDMIDGATWITEDEHVGAMDQRVEDEA